MNTFTIVLLIIVLVMLAAFIVLYYFTNKMEKQQDEQRAQMDAMAQPVTMLIIDKKKVKLKDSGLPQQVIDSSPWYLRRSKVSIVKAKIGARVTVLMCDDQVFPLLPVKREVKCIVSGIYITAAKGVRVPLESVPEKKGFFAKLFGK